VNVVRVDIERHTPAFERKFEEAVAELPEVVSCHVISGEGAFLPVAVSDRWRLSRSSPSTP